MGIGTFAPMPQNSGPKPQLPYFEQHPILQGLFSEQIASCWHWTSVGCINNSTETTTSNRIILNVRNLSRPIIFANCLENNNGKYCASWVPHRHEVFLLSHESAMHGTVKEVSSLQWRTCVTSILCSTTESTSIPPHSSKDNH